jgi:RHS repeat-associated protein
VTGTDGSSSFTYDNTDQLTGVDYSFQTDENYTYDDNGNRTNAGYVTGVNNRLLEDNKFRYEYDLVGNRTRRTDKLTGEETDYSWDVRDRLTGLVVKNALGEEVRSAGYTYDVYNQRIAKTVDMDGAGAGVATTERYVYGSDQNIDLIFDQNGNVSHRYLFGNGVDQIEADESGGSVLWALTDYLGSVRDVVDNAGVVQNHVVYDAFGGVTSQTNASVVFRYGYTARELDAESGLQYNRARYLDSFNGRFISEDPISFAGGDANLSRYVWNSPINYTDAVGLEGRGVTVLLDPESGSGTGGGGGFAGNLGVGSSTSFGGRTIGGSVPAELYIPRVPQPSYVSAPPPLGGFFQPFSPISSIFPVGLLNPSTSGSAIGQYGQSAAAGFSAGTAIGSIYGPFRREGEFDEVRAFAPYRRDPNSCQRDDGQKRECIPTSRNIILGGSYAAVRINSEGGQIHHMPAWQSIVISGIKLGVGGYSVLPNIPYRPQTNQQQGYFIAPAICMQSADHRKTASFSKYYRDSLAFGISTLGGIEGFNWAQNLDIVDVRGKFGFKYDFGIKQMLNYTQQLQARSPSLFL